jgi:hypothetical protein
VSSQRLVLPALHAYNAGMQYTLRNITRQTDRLLRAKAKAEGKSLNALAVELLERGLGLHAQPRVYHDLDDLFGSGALDDASLKAIKENDVIDMDEWR